MDYEYPSFGLESQYQGTSAQGYYYFLVFARTGGAANAVMIQMSPPRGMRPTREPQPQAYAAAALKIVSDMRRVLRDGVERHARDIMREERRFTARDEAEKIEAAENAFRVAELIGDQELAEAEADLEKQVKERPAPKKRKTWMGDDAPATSGARELVREGFKVLREIPVPGKGPGLWYEVLEPKSLAPKDWSPSGKPKDQLLMLRQPSGVWHAFYQFRGTGSGDTPTRALTGGLGDVFEHDTQIRAYCAAIMAAPRGLSREYEGLAAAQGACFNESQSG